MSRLTRLERKLMEAEYLIDSTNMHVRQKKCGDVKPRALGRYTKALNALRTAIQLVRNEQGARHPTLFAGGKGLSPQGFGKDWKPKAWGQHKTPHRWRKDCEDGKEANDMVKEEIGDGLGAECWFCDGYFVKGPRNYDKNCGLWRCPHCGKCGCDLDDFTKQAIEKTYRALESRP